MPDTKIYAVGAAGAVTIVLVWALKQWGKVDVPPEVASAITTIISTAAGYFAPHSAQIQAALTAQAAKVPGPGETL